MDLFVMDLKVENCFGIISSVPEPPLVPERPPYVIAGKRSVCLNVPHLPASPSVGIIGRMKSFTPPVKPFTLSRILTRLSVTRFQECGR